MDVHIINQVAGTIALVFLVLVVINTVMYETVGVTKLANRVFTAAYVIVTVIGLVSVVGSTMFVIWSN
jgi:uncharacterized membrane protein